jgi:hypothetical protein
MEKRAKASNKLSAKSVRKKALLVRVKILNASSAENTPVIALTCLRKKSFAGLPKSSTRELMNWRCRPNAGSRCGRA